MSDEETDSAEEGLEYHPDAKVGGLYCFLDSDRVCSADCMAFSTRYEDESFLDPQQRQCLLLVSLEKLPRFVGGGVSILKKEYNARQSERGDRHRAAHVPPPDPSGKVRS